MHMEGWIVERRVAENQYFEPFSPLGNNWWNPKMLTDAPWWSASFGYLRFFQILSSEENGSKYAVHTWRYTLLSTVQASTFTWWFCNFNTRIQRIILINMGCKCIREKLLSNNDFLLFTMVWIEVIHLSASITALHFSGGNNMFQGIPQPNISICCHWK